MKKIFLSVIPLFIALHISATVFDNVQWIFEKNKNNITLYVQGKKNSNLNYYKAETVIKGLNIQSTLYNIMDCNEYKKIFKNIQVFKIVKRLGSKHFIIHSELNFFPYKNRTYFTECKYREYLDKNNRRVYSLEWEPTDLDKHKEIVKYDKNAKLVNIIYGRWTIKELENDNVYISLEYHNDWETNLPTSFFHKIEKFITMLNLQNMVKYSLKKQNLKTLALK